MRTYYLTQAGSVPLAKYSGDCHQSLLDEMTTLTSHSHLFDHGAERTYIHNNVTAHSNDSATNRNRVRGEVVEIRMMNTQIREMLVGRVF